MTVSVSRLPTKALQGGTKMGISLGTVEEFEKLKGQKAALEVLKDLDHNSITPAYTEAINKLMEQILTTGSVKTEFVSNKVDFALGTFNEEGDYEPIKLVGGKDIDDANFQQKLADTAEEYTNLKFKKIFKTRTVVSNPEGSASSMFSPCKYVTYNSSSLNIISDNYHYANNVDNMPICSHPELIKDSGVTFCSYIACQSDCAKYHSDFQTLKSTTVTSEATSVKYEYELAMTTVISFFDSVKCYSFKINNVTSGTVVNELYYPCDVIDFDNAKAEAIRIYDEYISTYNGENSDYNVHTIDGANSIQNVSITPKRNTVSFLDHTLSFA